MCIPEYICPQNIHIVTVDIRTWIKSWETGVTGGFEQP